MLNRVKQASASIAIALVLTLAALLCLCAARQQHPLILVKSSRQPALSVHPLLQRLLIVISFNWDTHKLVFLKETVRTFSTWQTEVDVCIVTNGPNQLQRVFDEWGFTEPGRFNLSICHVDNVDDYDRGTEPYGMLWKHREVMEREHKRRVYTAYIYTEDDQEITWPAIQSWAADTEILEPLGFYRAFYRTEVMPSHGRSVLMDVWPQFNLTEWTRKVHVEVSTTSCRRVGDSSIERFWSWTEHPHGCQHEDFVALSRPYVGMWLASHMKLERFIAGPTWTKEGALAAEPKDTLGLGDDSWYYPERASNMIQLLDPPEGFFSSMVVPYLLEPKAVLAPIARVRHMRNGYAREGLAQHNVVVEDLMVT